MWQDYLVTINNLFCIYSLIPMIRSTDQKPPLLTSILSTYFCLCGIAIFASYHCLIGAASTAIIAVQWTFITRQRFILDGRPPLAAVRQQALESIRFS